MGRVYHRQSRAGQNELPSGDIGGIVCGVYGQGVLVVQLKCVRCGLLNEEKAIVKLLHPRCVCEGHGNELACAECLTITETVCRQCNHRWKSRCYILGGELPSREM